MKPRIINKLTTDIPKTVKTLSAIDAEYEGVPTKEINEVVDYMAIPSDGTNALDFWRAQRNRFPELFKYVRKYMVMQASSAPSECTFSVVGRIQNTRRHMSDELHESYLLARELYKLESNIAKYGNGTQ